jgi:hypothetical protein
MDRVIRFIAGQRTLIFREVNRFFHTTFLARDNSRRARRLGRTFFSRLQIFEGTHTLAETCGHDRVVVTVCRACPKEKSARRIAVKV